MRLATGCLSAFLCLMTCGATALAAQVSECPGTENCDIQAVHWIAHPTFGADRQTVAPALMDLFAGAALDRADIADLGPAATLRGASPAGSFESAIRDRLQRLRGRTNPTLVVFISSHAYETGLVRENGEIDRHEEIARTLVTAISEASLPGLRVKVFSDFCFSGALVPHLKRELKRNGLTSPVVRIDHYASAGEHDRSPGEGIAALIQGATWAARRTSTALDGGEANRCDDTDSFVTLLRSMDPGGFDIGHWSNYRTPAPAPRLADLARLIRAREQGTPASLIFALKDVVASERAGSIRLLGEILAPAGGFDVESRIIAAGTLAHSGDLPPEVLDLLEGQFMEISKRVAEMPKIPPSYSVEARALSALGSALVNGGGRDLARMRRIGNEYCTPFASLTGAGPALDKLPVADAVTLLSKILESPTQARCHSGALYKLASLQPAAAVEWTLVLLSQIDFLQTEALSLDDQVRLGNLVGSIAFATKTWSTATHSQACTRLREILENWRTQRGWKAQRDWVSSQFKGICGLSSDAFLPDA